MTVLTLCCSTTNVHQDASLSFLTTPRIFPQSTSQKKKKKKKRGLFGSSTHDPLLERFKCSPFSARTSRGRLISARELAAALGCSAPPREATAADSSARGGGGGQAHARGGGGGRARARGAGAEGGRAPAGAGGSHSPTPGGWRTWPLRPGNWEESPECSWATFGEDWGCSPLGKMN